MMRSPLGRDHANDFNVEMICPQVAAGLMMTASEVSAANGGVSSGETACTSDKYWLL
jgi:hypothetical protein